MPFHFPLPERLARLIRPPRSLPVDMTEVYQARRDRAVHERLCHAPFNNMYFSVTGRVGACWLTISPFESDRWSDERSIRDIWFGDKFDRWRRAILDQNLRTYCSVCEHNIRCGRRSLSLVYDHDLPESPYPTLMEMELSNFCGLECVMCSGMLSSSIREHREGKKPLKSPYNERFVEQLREFIPHLHELRFTGGEPFRQRIVYHIFEEIEKLRPDLRVVVTTSGVLYSPVMARWFDRINLQVGLSVDSLIADRYEKIRVNARFSTVRRNIDHYLEIAHRHQRPINLIMNPMRMNWDELPHFVRFCNERNMIFSVNTVVRPKHVALWALPAAELQRIYDTLAAEQFEYDEQSELQRWNVTVFNDVVHGQIASWRDRRKKEILPW